MSSSSSVHASLILHRVNPTGKEIGRGAYGRVFEVDYEGTICAAKNRSRLCSREPIYSAMSSSSSVHASLILHRVNPTGKEIGRGAYGRVFEVDYEGTICAAKEVHALLLQSAQPNELKRIKDGFLTECQIWSTLRHPCVVQFLGVYYPAIDQYKLPVMVMEKMQHSLRDVMDKYDNIPLNVKLSILDDVCLGLRYLHNKEPPIVHRDLTPNNILLGGHLEAKITDLGVAKVLYTGNRKTMTKVPGTPDFMPPEAQSNKPKYGTPLDVFSYGGVILNVITQVWPEPSDRNQFNPDTKVWEVVSEVKRRQHYLDMMSKSAADLKLLATRCLDDDPDKRPELAQVSIEIKKAKDACILKRSHDGISPILWWAEVSNNQQSQVTSSNDDAMKDEIEQLKTEIDIIKAETVQLKLENDELKARVNASTPQEIEQQAGVTKSDNVPVDLFNGKVNIKWKEGVPAPVRRVKHTAVWLNGLVYVGGGTGTGWNTSYTINSYDPVHNSWSSTINAPYCHFAMTTLNNSLLIAGGQKRNKKTTQILTLDAGQLKNYTNMRTARSSATAAGHQGILIVTAGKDDKDKTLSSTELFDSTNRQWYNCSDLPQPHSMLRSVIVDNFLYLLGGYCDIASAAVYSVTLDSLSTHQLEWNTHRDTPWCLSAPVGINVTHLLLIGGCKKIGDKNPSSSDIYKFMKVNHSWEAIGQIPSARHLSAAVSTDDNKIVVIGGVNDKGEYTNTVWIGSCKPQ